MPAAKKATKASQNKTRKSAKASPGTKAKKAPVRLMGKAKRTKGVVAFKKAKPPAGEPRNVILELWKAKEEKRRNEAPHTKFHQTGPPSQGYAQHHKHDSFARFSGPRRRAS